MVVGERNFINKSAKDQMQEAVAEVYSLAGQWALLNGFCDTDIGTTASGCQCN
jgi:hypothetical protein